MLKPDFGILNSFLIEEIAGDHDVSFRCLLSTGGQHGFQEEQMTGNGPLHHIITRRRLLGAAGVGALALSSLAGHKR